MKRFMVLVLFFCTAVCAVEWNPGVKITQNTVLAGSNGAGDQAPRPRALVNNDLPIVSLAKGGTNANLTAAAGGVVYSGASGFAISNVGSTGQILMSTGATPVIWSTPTYPNAAVLGDVIIASAANQFSTLSGNTTTSEKFFSQTGDGVNSAAPAWGIPHGYSGGTGRTSYTAGAIPYAPTGVWNGATMSEIVPNSGVGNKFLRTVSSGAPSYQSVTSTDVGLGNVENTALSTWAGTTNITTLGTVTTGTWSATTVAVNKGGTGITSGTSGGIPYFSGSTTIASSAALTQYGIVYGGGAGATPVALAAMTNGQLIVGSTGAAPQVVTMSGGGTISNAGVFTRTDLSCRAKRTSTQAISATTDTVVLFDAEDYDTDTMHSTVSNTGRITLTTAGKYHVSCAIMIDGNATVGVKIRLNGSTVIAREVVGNANPQGVSVSTDYSFSAADYVEFVIFTGGAVNVTAEAWGCAHKFN